MATISISFDTVTKKMTAALDGAELPDVVGVSLFAAYDEEDEFECRLVQCREDDASDIRYMTTLCASEGGAVTATKAPTKTRLETELASFFRREA